MMHEDAVLCLCFSYDSDYLASGSQDGKVKVWDIKTGKCVRKFESAHTKGVSCLCFAKDGTQLLSGSFDQTLRYYPSKLYILIILRIHGLLSGKTLKMFRGHNSFVNDCSFNPEATKVLSVSSDGTIKIWDSKTTDCLQTYIPSMPGTEATIKDTSIHSISLNPKNPDQFYICNRSTIVYLMNMKGQVRKLNSFYSNWFTGY